MAIENRFVVVSFGARGLTAPPNEKWFYRLYDADAEIRRRLKLRRLHKYARKAGKRSPFPSQDREGLTWNDIWSVDYRAVPRSHRDFKTAAGCAVHQMRAVTEDKPFVNPFAPKS